MESGLINAGRLALMKPTAVLVNTSRGPVIDEQALAQALRQGQIFAAGLDVFEREPDVHPGLLACHNAVLIPHLGSATVKTRLAMADLAADNLLAGLEDEEPADPAQPAGLGTADLERISPLIKFPASALAVMIHPPDKPHQRRPPRRGRSPCTGTATTRALAGSGQPARRRTPPCAGHLGRGAGLVT